MISKSLHSINMTAKHFIAFANKRFGGNLVNLFRASVFYLCWCNVRMISCWIWWCSSAKICAKLAAGHLLPLNVSYDWFTYWFIACDHEMLHISNVTDIFRVLFSRVTAIYSHVRYLITSSLFIIKVCCLVRRNHFVKQVNNDDVIVNFTINIYIWKRHPFCLHFNEVNVFPWLKGFLRPIFSFI